MYQPRQAEARLLRLFEHFPIVVLIGARQVGKSTTLKHLFGDTADFTVFDPVVDIGGAREDPDLFLDNHQPPAVLDEIQYAPELVPSLKRRVDEQQRPSLYIVTGSQQWQVMRAISESLAGRAAFIELGGFTFLECAGSTASWLGKWLRDPEASSKKLNPLQQGPRLFDQIWRGFLPRSQSLEEDLVSEHLASYRRTYIERDVRAMGEVDNWQTFGRFTQLMGALTAQEINYSQLGREISVTPQTAKRWLAMLHATFQWFEIPAFATNAIKRVSQKPKGYISDTGLACQGQAIPEPSVLGGHPLLGPLFESAVVSDLRKQARLLPTQPTFYHWRSAGGAKVDLILDYGGTLYPFEMKCKSHPTRRDAQGISAFRSSYPNRKIAPGIVISAGNEVRPLDESTLVIPWNVVAS